MKRAIHALLAVTIFIGLTVGIAGPAQAYSTTWTKAQALNYASDGVYERYVFGGAKFRNNNKWDSDEGADCSGYAAKVWAVDRYTYTMTNYHPYGTYHYYSGFAYGVHKDRRYPATLNTWTYRDSAGGPGDHMGLFISPNTNGTWVVYEAKGASYGIVSSTRSVSTLISWGYRRSDRKNWGA